MRLFRVTAWREDARAGEPGHPLFVDVARQGAGRADNPRHYQALYLSETAQGAIGEVFGDLTTWSDHMFAVPWLPQGGRAIATLRADPAPHVLDLDDPQVLLDLGARPTDVVGRDRERTRELALSVWMQDRWDGLRWWSWWRPAWRNQVLWAAVDAPSSWPLEVADVQPLDMRHPAVRVAADVLRRHER